MLHRLDSCRVIREFLQSLSKERVDWFICRTFTNEYLFRIVNNKYMNRPIQETLGMGFVEVFSVDYLAIFAQYVCDSLYDITINQL